MSESNFVSHVSETEKKVNQTKASLLLLIKRGTFFKTPSTFEKRKLRRIQKQKVLFRPIHFQDRINLSVSEFTLIALWVQYSFQRQT